MRHKNLFLLIIFLVFIAFSCHKKEKYILVNGGYPNVKKMPINEIFPDSIMNMSYETSPKKHLNYVLISVKYGDNNEIVYNIYRFNDEYSAEKYFNDSLLNQLEQVYSDLYNSNSIYVGTKDTLKSLAWQKDNYIIAIYTTEFYLDTAVNSFGYIEKIE